MNNGILSTYTHFYYFQIFSYLIFAKAYALIGFLVLLSTNRKPFMAVCIIVVLLCMVMPHLVAVGMNFPDQNVIRV